MPNNPLQNPQVKIHLNLRNPALAESSLKAVFMQNGQEHAVTVAYARQIVMRNITPEVEDWKRDRIANDPTAFKTPCAYLTGELVAWSGRVRDLVPEKHHELRASVAALQVEDATLDADIIKALQAGDAVGFNPKKASVFYRQPAQGADITESFQRAAGLVACHWRFMVLDGTFATIDAAALETCPAAPSGFENQAIPQGFATTRKRLEEVAPTL
ncbi:MAG: hypothetical protein KJ667_00860, partial [Alphaproteobacteria bacterium]|nr:hypothetical protein [Alphaproteobacteria bacterium]